MKMNKKMIYATVAFVGVLACLTVAYAALFWSQGITWDFEAANKAFTVDRATTIDYGSIVGETIKTEVYQVTNTGNVEITVTASTPTLIGALANWDINPQTIAKGATATFTLTLTINGVGSCTVAFTGD